MIRKVLLPLLAIAGIVFAIYTVRVSQQKIEPAEPVAAPPTSEFSDQIAGAGLVEAASENISIGSVVPGTVTEVFVQVGQEVKKDQKLFEVDTRDLQAQLVVKQALADAARAKLNKSKASPRPEDVPPVAAELAVAEAQLADAKDSLNRFQAMKNASSGTVSRDEYNRALYAVDVAEARRRGAESQLALVKAGTWAPDVKIAEAEVASAEAEVEALKVEWTRRTVVAPIDGRMLQVKVRAGEYAPSGAAGSPLILMGDVATKNVRVDIDENDAWRLQSGSAATGSLRGNSRLSTPLKFVRVEPYVLPKRSLTGESTERVDTRVLQVIFKITDTNFPVYVGQQMDVFIKVDPDEEKQTSAGTKVSAILPASTQGSHTESKR